MAVESSYSVLKQALVDRWKNRPNLVSVNVLPHVPVNKDDMRTETGAYEVVALAGAEGTFDDVVFCAGDLRFDETFELEILIEVHGTDSTNGTQQRVDARVNELLFEVLADVAAQKDWDFAALGLDVFDYLFFTPSTQDWGQGRLQQATGVYAANVAVGLGVQARRSF